MDLMAECLMPTSFRCYQTVFVTHVVLNDFWAVNLECTSGKMIVSRATQATWIFAGICTVHGATLSHHLFEIGTVAKVGSRHQGPEFTIGTYLIG